MSNNSDSEVKLLGHKISPFVSRVTWALKIKGVEFEFIIEDLYNKSTRLLESNPVHKKVPVLIHAGKPIAESTVILEYIEETWPQNPLLPDIPYERAVARFWVKYVEEKVEPALWSVLGFRTTEREKHVDAALQVLQVVEDHLKDKNYFVGENIGVADIVAGLLAYFIGPLEDFQGIRLLDEDRFPAIHSWKRRILNTPAVNNNIPTRDAMMNHFKNLKQRVEAAASTN